jgi:hypothetical protein
MSNCCPTCGHKLASAWEPKRICYLCLCQKPILKHHKYVYDNPDGSSRVRHRNCSSPEDYPTSETLEAHA